MVLTYHNSMKRIECLISDDISNAVDKIVEYRQQTRAEFNRRAIENYIEEELTAQNVFKNKINKFLENE